MEGVERIGRVDAGRLVPRMGSNHRSTRMPESGQVVERGVDENAHSLLYSITGFF